ncbi:MAG TPA: type VII secretion-associated serine protease mycosin [Pseudonocardia sp.]|uniref:type VII secretion-associated serine protease mycosin n=1 Tax=Pseudonocardia sp. TaxID=60912 RepID=UPI002CD07E6F|nr:type VII secretion-associated serine protease mycosin [Pseudonocardia sp.]HTF51421.1 type VII secretion-associated serine protease mycosin [Pseudonocardia sp.]
MRPTAAAALTPALAALLAAVPVTALPLTPPAAVSASALPLNPPMTGLAAAVGASQPAAAGASQQAAALGADIRASQPASHPAASAADMPLPPPVDAEALPADGPPRALPGVRQDVQCSRGTHTPDAASVAGLLWGQRVLALPRLGSLSSGRGVRIAVIDTGVSPHPLLAGRLLAGGDYVAGGNGLADCDGHGTAVAGIAAAAADPGTGFSGVAPAAQVISIRQSSPSFTVPGRGGVRQASGNLSTLAMAVVHAVDLGADVINISEVACAEPNAPGSAELHAAVRAALLRNVVVVAAAGNFGSGSSGECPGQPEAGTVVYPAWFDDEVLAVAAVGPNGLASPFSYPGPWVDVAAPGERLMSLTADGSGLTDQLSQVLRTSSIDGTSFAAPMVAGLAALIRARYPQLTARQVMDRITATAAQRASGRGDSVGYGAVDALAALTRIPAVLPPPSSVPANGDTGTLRLTPTPSDQEPAGGALWGGALALLATLTAAALAVGRLRAGATPAADRLSRRDPG